MLWGNTNINIINEVSRNIIEFIVPGNIIFIKTEVRVPSADIGNLSQSWAFYLDPPGLLACSSKELFSFPICGL
jgi:hypothetical protein